MDRHVASLLAMTMLSKPVITLGWQIPVIASEAWQSMSWCQATSSGQYKRIGLSTSSLC